MAATDISAKIRATALAEIEKQSFGEDFGFDCSLFVLQHAGGRMLVGYNMVTTCRSPLLGQPPLMTVAQLMSADPGAEEIERLVTEAMRGLREFAANVLKGNVVPSQRPAPNLN